MDLYKLLDNISYDNYIKLNKLKSSFLPLSIGSLTTCLVSGELVLLPLTFLLVVMSLYLGGNKLFLNVKEVKEINALYQEFLESYHKLNGTFNINNPIELMVLFKYLLNRGYLSKEHKHKYLVSKNDQPLLAGTYPFTGESCCRHDGVLLSDILTKEGIKSSTLIGYETFAITSDIISDLIPLCFMSVLNPDSFKYSEKFRDYNIDLEIKRKEGFIRDEDFRIISYSSLEFNHLITIAKKDSITYFLDPTSDAVYRKKIFDGKEVLVSGVGVIIPKVGLGYKKAYTEHGRNIFDTRRMLEGMNATLEEELEARRKVNEITRDNQDIFEQFYRENVPLYEEVSMRLEKVRRK